MCIRDSNGAGNTVAIMMQSGHTNSAAQHCADLAYSGYDDWYLPSKDELNLMYSQRAAINATATANGGETFLTSFYWSSSEFDNDHAWAHDFFLNSQGSTLKFNPGGNIRAIRAF